MTNSSLQITSRKRTLPSLAVVSTVKCSPDQLWTFVNYHLRNGIGRLYLFFDDSEDPSFSAVSENEGVTAVVCDQEYWKLAKEKLEGELDTTVLTNRQRYNATHALSLAKDDGVDWIIHIDSDEFVFPIRRLLRKLRRSGRVAYRLTPVEAIPTKIEPTWFFDGFKAFKKPATLRFPTLLRYPINSMRLLIAKVSGCREIFRYNPAFFRGHIKSKCCAKLTPDLQELWIHEPVFSKRIPIPRLLTTYLVHYDSNGYSHWKRKWLLKAENNVMQKKPSSKVNSYITFLTTVDFMSSSDEELSRIYTNTHFINEKELRILKAVGLIKNIKEMTDLGVYRRQ